MKNNIKIAIGELEDEAARLSPKNEEKLVSDFDTTLILPWSIYYDERTTIWENRREILEAYIMEQLGNPNGEITANTNGVGFSEFSEKLKRISPFRPPQIAAQAREISELKIKVDYYRLEYDTLKAKKELHGSMIANVLKWESAPLSELLTVLEAAVAIVDESEFGNEAARLQALEAAVESLRPSGRLF